VGGRSKETKDATSRITGTFTRCDRERDYATVWRNLDERGLPVMTLPISIASLFHGKAVEWERLEFKEGWNPLEVLHTLCAFANDFHNLGGGYIVVGVAQKDGQPVLPPVGLAAARLDAIQREILNLGHSAMQPSYHPIVVPEVVDGKNILILWAPGGQTRPYKAKLRLGKDCKDWGYDAGRCCIICFIPDPLRHVKRDGHEIMTFSLLTPFVSSRSCGESPAFPDPRQGRSRIRVPHKT
jgi:hypothetical protein